MQSNPTILIAVVCGFLAVMLGMLAAVIYAAPQEQCALCPGRPGAWLHAAGKY